MPWCRVINPFLVAARHRRLSARTPGESFSVNNSTQLLGDLYLPGTPAIQLGTGSQHGGTVNDGGAAAPANYSVTLNNNAVLPGRIHTRSDAVALPTDFPTSVPASAGTRSVTVRSQSDIAAIGNWQTVRDLNVAGSRLTINLPPGNYGTLTVNGNSQVNLSAAYLQLRQHLQPRWQRHIAVNRAGSNQRRERRQHH